MEFRSRYYGQRLTPLLIVQSAAIWVSVLLFVVLILTPVLQHGRPLDAGRLTGLLVLPAAAAAFQWLAVRTWRRTDDRKVTWDAENRTLAVFGFRLTSSMLSPGRRVERVELSADELLAMKVVRGRGTQLRLHTTKGFLCLTNDLQAFDELCDLVRRQLPKTSQQGS